MIFKNYSGKRNEDIKSFIYDRDEVEKLKKEYLKTSSPALSPIIKANLKAIRNYRNGDSKALDSFIPKGTDIDIYLEELAKANIFIKSLKVTENIKNLDDNEKLVLEKMFIESAFASYQFQKANSLPLATFNKYFSTNTGSPFHNFKGIMVDANKCGSGDGFSQDGTIYLNPNIEEITFDKYCLSTIETLTHELQHITSGNGTCKGRPLFFKREAFNEMCTEAIASKIVSQNLDDGKFERDIKLLRNNGKFEIAIPFLKHKTTSKTMEIKSPYKSYIEAAVLFDAFDEICDHKLFEIYYSQLKKERLVFLNIEKPVNVDNSLSKKSKKFLPLMYNTVDKAYHGLVTNKWTYKYNDHTYYERDFDAMIDSFAKLSESYVRSLGLNKSITPESLQGAEIFVKVNEFFKTFESITFQKKGESFTQAQLLKEKVLGAIYNNDKSSEAAIKRLEEGDTYIQQFKYTFDTANFTLGKTLTKKWGIDFSKDLQSKDNSKDNSKNKDNSKDIDLDL